MAGVAALPTLLHDDSSCLRRVKYELGVNVGPCNVAYYFSTCRQMAVSHLLGGQLLLI